MVLSVRCPLEGGGFSDVEVDQMEITFEYDRPRSSRAASSGRKRAGWAPSHLLAETDLFHERDQVIHKILLDSLAVVPSGDGE